MADPLPDDPADLRDTRADVREAIKSTQRFLNALNRFKTAEDQDPFDADAYNRAVARVNEWLDACDITVKPFNHYLDDDLLLRVGLAGLEAQEAADAGRSQAAKIPLCEALLAATTDLLRRIDAKLATPYEPAAAPKQRRDAYILLRAAGGASAEMIATEVADKFPDVKIGRGGVRKVILKAKVK